MSIEFIDESEFVTARADENWWILETDSLVRLSDMSQSFMLRPVDASAQKQLAEAKGNARKPDQVEKATQENDDDVAIGWRLVSEDDDGAAFVRILSWRDALINQGQSKLSVLYNVFRAQSGKVTLSTSRDMWLLGRQYSFIGCTIVQQQLQLASFMHDFCTRLYFSYRRDFPPIQPTNQQTDMGWGCVHRAGQMLLAGFFSRRCSCTFANELI
jgi:hypothetical protein